MRDWLGGLMAEIDIEHGNIATELINQRDCLGNGISWADDFEPGLGNLLRNIERDQELILDHKHPCAHVHSASLPLSSLAHTSVSGHANRHISPEGAKSSSTSP